MPANLTHFYQPWLKPDLQTRDFVENKPEALSFNVGVGFYKFTDN